MCLKVDIWDERMILEKQLASPESVALKSFMEWRSACIDSVEDSLSPIEAVSLMKAGRRQFLFEDIFESVEAYRWKGGASRTV